MRTFKGDVDEIVAKGSGIFKLGYIKKYQKIIKGTVKFPKRIGYNLDSLHYYNNGNIKISAAVGTYPQNLMQIHILEYELYRAYKNCQKNSVKIEGMPREKLLELLPLRRYYHKNTPKNESDILTNGDLRRSQLSVQIFTMLPDPQAPGKYQTLRIRRSGPDKIAVKPYFYQFIPSGGFEALNDEIQIDAIKDNFKLTQAVFRELLEECFNVPEKIDADKDSIHKMEEHPIIKKPSSVLEDPNDHRVHFQFIGLAQSLVGLRLELCFLLRIDDIELFKDGLENNFESDERPKTIPIDELETTYRWHDADGNSDLHMLNCTSAALFELVETILCIKRPSSLPRRSPGNRHDAIPNVNVQPRPERGQFDEVGVHRGRLCAHWTFGTSTCVNFV